MSEVRKHPLIERWVIINKDRAARPGFTYFPKVEKKSASCPFCGGNESSTPPEICAVRDNGGKNEPGWRIRVVPNKFPALETSEVPAEIDDGIYKTIRGFGAHEVVIESPDHFKDIEDLDAASFTDVIRVLRDRFRILKTDDRIKYIQLFKNHGLMGGASFEHTHCQIIAMPVVSKTVSEEDATAMNYYATHASCIFCDMIRKEIESKDRIVAENEMFIAFCPFAPRFAFETWIMPKFHQSHFESLEEGSLSLFAVLFKDILMRLKTSLNNPAYNFMLYTSPAQNDEGKHYHWRVEITPQRTPIAGFERGSGFYINSTSPESAAAILKKPS